jgi:hypothetical protein
MPERITRMGMRIAPTMKAVSCLVCSRLVSWWAPGRRDRLGTCCEKVAARDKKKEENDMGDDQGGSSIS